MKSCTGLILLTGFILLLLSFVVKVENQAEAQPVNMKGLMRATLAAG